MSQKSKKRAYSPNEKLLKAVSYASVATAIAIIVAKLSAWIMTDSLSLLTSLVDSVLDLVISLINLLAIRYALQPADEEHRFGHGKAEDIAALIQSAFIFGSGIFVLVEASNRFFNKVTIYNESYGIWVMVVSSVLTVFLICFQRYVARKTGSNIVKADMMHYQVDLLVNMLVIVSLSISLYLDFALADILMAIAISLYIFKGGYEVGRGAFDNLMDREFSDPERQKILGLILEHKEVKGIHDLRTRKSGTKPFIQFHLELDGNMTLEHAHDISEQVAQKLSSEWDSAEILIHQDPADKEDVPIERGRVVPVKK